MRSGTTVAHYEVEELLGRGGMGEVYRARDTRLERPVALKFLAARFLSDPEAKARFIREAKSASALDHPNICTIHDFGETRDGELYMVMALYDGRTLDERLSDGEEFSPERTEGILHQLAQALKRAHEAGIVHRDLKPANVMVGPDDAVRLLDFGIAKLQSEAALTRTGTTLGTAAWMSPEQAAADPVTPATDVWSLGVIGYRLLTGRLPFDAENPLACLNQILTLDPTPVRELAPECPPRLADAIDAALRKRPEARPPDGAAFLEQLAGPGAAPNRSRPPGEPPGLASLGSTWTVPRVIAAVIVTLLAVGFAWSRIGNDPMVPVIAAEIEPSDDVLLVLPFSVSGDPDYEYLGEGLMDLLTGRLDGAGPIRTVDPRATVAALDDEDSGRAPEAGGRLASRFGAGSFVTGQFVALPGSVSISARIHVTATGEQRPLVTVEGSADSLFVLVDRLASGLLETSITGQNARIARRAAASSNSLAATRAFLEGEQYHRAGDFDAAASAYDRAVSIDTTFALAYLMKSINNAYTYETDDLEAAEKAMRFSDGLPERDRSLISAFLDQQNGELRVAEEKYLNHLRRWPDEVKAMWLLGRVYTRGNQRLGISLEPARSWLERVLEYEPESVQARHTLARVEAIDRRFDRIREHAEVVARVAPGTEWDVQLETMAAFALDDREAIDRIREEFPRLPLVTRLFATFHALLYARDPAESDDLIDLESTAEALEADVGIPDLDYDPEEAARLADYTTLLVVQNDIAFGRHDRVRAFLQDESRPGYDAPSWVMWEAELVVSGAVQVDDDLLRRTLERVETVDPERRMDLHFERLHDVFTPDVARLERDALRARLLIRLGRRSDAVEIRDAIERGPTYRGFASLREDVARSLTAELQAAQGDEAAALATLRSIEFQVSSAANSLAITDGIHARMQRADLEARLGDPDVAVHLLESVAGGPATTVKIYLGDAVEALGRIEESVGNREAGIYWTERYVRLRDAADAGLRASVADAERRLVRLRGVGND